MLDDKRPFLHTVNFNRRPFKFSGTQKKFLDLALGDSAKIIFLSGPAGSAKTYLSVYAALKLLTTEQVDELLYVRTIAESGDKSLGALPGDVAEKFDPFLMPLYDKLEEIVSTENIFYIKEFLKAIPINYLRGANLQNKVVVADESQNFSYKELVTLITRIGNNTKYFICGDPMQSDINGKSGFQKLYDKFDTEESRDNGIYCFSFQQSDIFRSEILKYIINVLMENRDL